MVIWQIRAASDKVQSAPRICVQTDVGCVFGDHMSFTSCSAKNTAAQLATATTIKLFFFNASSTLEDLDLFDDESDLEKAIIGCPNLGSNDGLTVIISDFFTYSDWKKAVDYLCYKKKQVLLIQVVTLDETDPSYSGRVNLIDTESCGMDYVKNLKIRINRAHQLAYEEAIQYHLNDIRTFCNSRDVGFVTVRCDQPIEKVLFKELLKVGIMS
jgi:hypothetical protein